MSRNTHRPGTKKWFITEKFLAGIGIDSAFGTFARLVEEQRAPWIYKENLGGSRAPRPVFDSDVTDGGKSQMQLLLDDIRRVYAALERQEGIPSPQGQEEEIPTPDEDDEIPVPEPDDEPEEIKPPVKSKTARMAAEKQWFYDEWRRLRAWISATAETTGAIAVDSLDSMRPLISANALIEIGVPARALLYAMCMHWPKATLDMAGVEIVSQSGLFEPISSKHHAMSGYVQKLAEARQNIMLIGPAGSGKSRCIAQVADAMGLNYGETPMTPGATRGDLLGRHTLQGFVPSQFVEIYSQGGIFNFEEIDASDPSMLIVVNNALASDKLFNSVNGEVYDKHPDFIAASTANTFGLGADSKYTGREKLDLATIDRFRMARVMMTLDEDLARSMILS